MNSLQTPKTLLASLPTTPQNLKFIENSRQAIIDVLDGKDPRLLLIMGPCSIDNPIAAKQYAMNLKELSRQVEDTFLIVMRVYYEKPRTISGWKGLLYDPDLDGSHDLEKGLNITRKLLLDLTKLEVPIAAEILDPFSINYFSDLISWGCIGARTVSSQIHRQLASSLPFPIGFKNSTEGSIKNAVNGILAADESHVGFGIDENGSINYKQTNGNSYGHLVLRGGEEHPNYDAQSVTRAQRLLREADLADRLIIDCSHDNCGRVYEHQRVVFQSVIQQRLSGNAALQGLILESYLEKGNQNLMDKNLQFGVSLTDPCLSWQMTEQLVLWGQSQLSENTETQKKTTSTICAYD
jgi:3-deoxy-7-phosphoheptulonate synthase